MTRTFGQRLEDAAIALLIRAGKLAMMIFVLVFVLLAVAEAMH